MYYVKDEEFKPLIKQPFKLNDDAKKIPVHDATTGEVLNAILDFYSTQHLYFIQRGIVLSPKEIRSYNRLVDIFENKPALDNYFCVENADAEVLRRLIESIVPATPFFRHQEGIEKILESAPTQLPKGVELPDRNGHKASLPQKEKAKTSS